MHKQNLSSHWIVLLLSMLHVTSFLLKSTVGVLEQQFKSWLPPNQGQSAKRSQEFRQLFEIRIQSSIFESDSSHSSTFDKMCDTVLNMFSKKWHPSTGRIEYTATFSTAKWKALSDESISQSIPFPAVTHTRTHACTHTHTHTKKYLAGHVKYCSCYVVLFWLFR